MSSKLLTLKPRLDEDGVMRSDGGLGKCRVLTIQHQVSHNIAKKRVGNETDSKVVSSTRNHTAGTNQTLVMLLSRFWLMQGRKETRECERECYQC